jgi:hypothetical protein
VIIVETPTFTRRVLQLFNDETYRLLHLDDLTPVQLRTLRRLVEEEFK